MVRERKAECVDIVDALATACRDAGQHELALSLNAEIWLWAQTIVKSRGFQVPDMSGAPEGGWPLGTFVGERSDGSGPEAAPLTKVLVPLADMINHRYARDGGES